MKKRRKSLIIEDSPIFAKTIHGHLTSMDYDVVGVIESIDAAVKSISFHSPDVITLSLELENGQGLRIIEYIASNMQKLKVRPFVIIFSTNISDNDIKYANKHLGLYQIMMFYFNKELTYSPEYFSKILLLSEGYLRNNSNPYFNNPTLSNSKKANEIQSLDEVIRMKLKNHNVVDNSQSFEYLVFLIKECITDPPERNSMKVLYERSHQTFKVAPDSVEMAMKRLKLNPTPKKFIPYIAHQVKEEYSKNLLNESFLE